MLLSALLFFPLVWGKFATNLNDFFLVDIQNLRTIFLLRFPNYSISFLIITELIERNLQNFFFKSSMAIVIIYSVLLRLSRSLSRT